ncbi:MAG TPA: hypothetical protein VFY22_07310, partial [Hydrogenophaga sp.]|nr:hypothetical protein [Hydrogenophaga sp.]
MTAAVSRSRLFIVIAILLAVMALGLVGGGAWLMWLGGSPYYVLAGLTLGVVAFLMLKASPVAWWVYAALVLATLAWSLWEVGLEWWGLAARGDVFFLLGLLLVTPWVARRMVYPIPSRREAGGDHRMRSAKGWRGGRGALAV